MSACDTNRSAIDPSSYPSPNGALMLPTRDADTSDSMRRKSPGVNDMNLRDLSLRRRPPLLPAPHVNASLLTSMTSAVSAPNASPTPGPSSSSVIAPRMR